MTDSARKSKKPFAHVSHISMTLGDRVFLYVNLFFLFVLFLIFAYPLLYIISASFSGGAMLGGGLSLIPKEASLEGYKAAFEYKLIWTGYGNSLLYTVLGTLEAMIVQTLCAYVLSRKDFLGGKPLLALCIFSMYFEGGIVPCYLWIKQLGMLDTIWAVTLPFTISMYNMIVMRTYFSTQIPKDLHEAAQIDGCGDWRYLLTIVLPLSGPILAVITLYSAVYFWNAYFYPLIYMQTRTKLPLQNVLREILILNTSSQYEAGMDATTAALMSKRGELMKYSLIIVSSLPVLIMYPFVQKYFVKGVMIGAVKG